MRQKEIQISQLERHLDNKNSEQTSVTDQLKSLQEELRNKTVRISELQDTISGKNTEIEGTASMVEKVKSLHSEQCQELQEQIEQVSFMYAYQLNSACFGNSECLMINRCKFLFLKLHIQRKFPNCSIKCISKI